MRRLVTGVPVVVATALLAAGCGTGGKAVAHADTQNGQKLFTASCGGCHTLAAAGTSGTVGPNLDDAKPDYRKATARVTLGKGVMPSFAKQLTAQQIADVAAYVVTATGGTP